MSPVVATPLPELHHCDSFPHERCGAGCRRCDAELRAELKAEYKKRTAELADKYERKYAFLKDQYVKREREIKSKYDVALESRIEKYNDLVEKFNELKDRYESLRAHHASLL
jgi:predicted nuclease with TOPRIM domain